MMRHWRERLGALLARKTTSGRFVPEIDGLRFVAIWSVVFFHVYTYLTRKLALDSGVDGLARLLSKGAFGVQLFFVISGFIISLPFAQGEREQGQSPALGTYYRRRLTRLEPPYVLNLVLIAALLWMVGRHSLQELAPHFLASVTYTHNFVYGTPSLINGVAWSLEVECQFYVVAPLLAKVFLLRSTWQRQLILCAAVALTTAAAQFVVPRTPIWQQSLPAHVNYFLCGFLLADVFVTRRGQSRERSHGWDVIGGLCWLLTVAVLVMFKELRPLLPVPVMLACYSAFRGRLSSAIFSNRYIYTIGGMCYTIYLYHAFVIALCGRALLAVPGLASQPVWLVLCLGVAVFTPPVLLASIVLFVLTEKPFMNPGWPGSFVARWTALMKRPAPAETARTPR